MGTKERVEIINKSDNVINDLLKRISNLEFEVEERDRRIDKVIRFLETARELEYKTVIEILKGSDKE